MMTCPRSISGLPPKVSYWDTGAALRRGAKRPPRRAEWRILSYDSWPRIVQVRLHSGRYSKQWEPRTVPFAQRSPSLARTLGRSSRRPPAGSGLLFTVRTRWRPSIHLMTRRRAPWKSLAWVLIWSEPLEPRPSRFHRRWFSRAPDLERETAAPKGGRDASPAEHGSRPLNVYPNDVTDVRCGPKYDHSARVGPSPDRVITTAKRPYAEAEGRSLADGPVPSAPADGQTPVAPSAPSRWSGHAHTCHQRPGAPQPPWTHRVGWLPSTPKMGDLGAHHVGLADRVNRGELPIRNRKGLNRCRLKCSSGRGLGSVDVAVFWRKHWVR